MDRIVLVNEGRILADLCPDERCPAHCWQKTASVSRFTSRPCGMRALTSRPPSAPPTLTPSCWLTPIPRSCAPGSAPSRCLRPSLPRPRCWEVKGLSFGYSKDQHTLSDVSFTIGKGEMVSIVGRNGAGKSTLSKLICGFETPDSGEIFL